MNLLKILDRIDPPPISTPAGRRAWAFLALVGGSITFTVFAAVGVYLVSGHARYSFYLAIAAHGQIVIALSSLGALLIRRTIRIGKDGIELDDKGAAAQEVADAAQAEADEIKGE